MALSSPRTSKYCWVVAAACFWSNFCLLGVVRSSAVIFVALVNNLELSRKEAAWPSGIFGFSMCVSGVLSGYVNLYYSNRSIMMVGAVIASFAVSCCSLASDIIPIALLYGVFQGAGIGIIVPMTHVTLNQYFQQYKALAIGIAYSGSSVGSFFFPTLVHWMLEEFGLPNTFILLGSIMLQSLVGIAFLRPLELSTASTHNYKTSKQYNNLEQNKCINMALTSNTTICKRIINTEQCYHNVNADENKKNSNLKTSHNDTHHKSGYLFLGQFKTNVLLTIDILTNVTFLLISATFSIYFSTSAIFLMVILDFALDKHMLQQEGVFLISVFSIGDLAGRLLCGWIGDLKFLPRKFIVCCYLLIMSSFFICLPLCSTFAALISTSMILGVVSGGIMVNYSAILSEHMGLEKLPLSVGFSSCFIGITAFLRPLIIGYFRDQHQNYDALFQFLGAIQIVITVLWLSKSLSPYCKLF